MVANSSVSNAAAATVEWLQNGEGAKIVPNLIPVFECFENTQDQQNLNNAIGIDIYSKLFKDAVFDYMDSNPLSYWTVMNAANQQWKSKQGVGAGITMAELYILVVQNMNNNESI